MDYLDALASSSVTRADDGRRLFFPWGPLGRGYTVPSEVEFERLRRNVKIYVLTCVVLLPVTMAWKGVGGVLTLLPLLLLPYVLWARNQRIRLRMTAERLTWRESLALQARAHSTGVLWLLEAGALAFVAAGTLMLVGGGGHSLVGVAVIAFFGLCAAGYAWMLIARKKIQATRP